LTIQDTEHYDPYDHKELAAEHLLMGDNLNPDIFPELFNMSAAFFFQFIPCPKETLLPEFIYVPVDPEGKLGHKLSTEIQVTISEWNTLWEAGHLRSEFFRESLPKEISWIKKYKGSNFYLLPDAGKNKYDAYQPLYHNIAESNIEKV
jgi:hypothetical protein